MSEAPAVDFAVEDLRTLIALGLARAGDLLTAGERLIVRRMAALDGDAARLYARLSARRGTVFAVDRLELVDGDVAGAVEHLLERELLCAFVPWPQRTEVLTVEELKAECRKHGLKVGGRRAQLLGRLAGYRAGRGRQVVRLPHSGLLRRLLRFAQGRLHPDRSQWVLERMGRVRWPEYARTVGAAVLPTRRDMRRWEELLDRPLGLDEAMAALEDPTRIWPPGRLDPRRRLRRAVADSARELERQDELAAAERLYRRLGDRFGVVSVAVRLARVVERQGRGLESVELLRSARQRATAAERLAIDRAGKRVARSHRRSWAPSAPLQHARDRRLALVSDPSSEGRPTWGGGATIEHAVAEVLRRAGREVLSAEGPLFKTLFALCFADLYFLPVPGQLPAPFLSGPLDLGTPQFRRRRRAAVQSRLAKIAGGQAGEVVGHAAEAWWNVRLRGARWDLWSPSQLAALAHGMQATALAALLEQLLERGLGAAAGLPDLVVLPGHAVRLEGAHPSKLREGLSLIEVKGPSDSLRDEQRAWHDRLLRAGASVEIWKIQKAAKAPHGV